MVWVNNTGQLCYQARFQSIQQHLANQKDCKSVCSSSNLAGLRTVCYENSIIKHLTVDFRNFQDEISIFQG